MDTKTLCLGALTLGDATGYEIKKRFQDTFGYFLDVGFSSIYPALSDLHRDSLITCTKVEQETRPDKKVYTLTEAGRQTFVDSLMTTPARHKVRSEFIALLFFAHFLPRWRVEGVLDERLAEAEKLIDLTENWLKQDGVSAPAGVRFAAEYGLSSLRAAADFIRGNREQLLAEIPEKEPLGQPVKG